MINNNKEKIKLKFVVEKIRHHNPDSKFSVIQAKFEKFSSTTPPSSTSEIVITGFFVSIFVGDEYEGVGYWTKHNIFGLQFVLENHERVLPATEKTLREFLTKFVKGVGKKTANLVVDEFKLNTLGEIEKGWENIAKIKGVGKVKAQIIYKEYMKHRNFEEIAIFTMSQGLTYKDCLKIYETFEGSAIFKIRENPYVLCTIDKIEFKSIDFLAKNLGFPFNHPLRVQAVILCYVKRQVKQNGHIFIFPETLFTEMNGFLSKISKVYSVEELSRTDLDSALMNLKNNSQVEIQTDAYGKYIYLPTFSFIENDIIHHLKRLIKNKKTSVASMEDIQKLIVDYEGDVAYSLGEKQKEAIVMALTERVSILTGSPGTGKTQTINAVIEVIKGLNPLSKIELCAPTGKASNRMTELTGREAKTIHRLIGLNEFDDNAKHEVDADFLIVDEASMIDASIFYKLLSALANDTRILLVGDAEQLPSVGAGLILRDLIASKRIPVTQLTEVFRQAQNSQIIMNAHAVVSGNEKSLTFDHSKGDCYWIETTEKSAVQDKIIGSISRMLITKRFELDDIQVLAPMHHGEVGVNDLNQRMQAEFNERNFSKGELKISHTSLLREGDKVMQTINNYSMEVFNGEVGKIKTIEKDGDECKVEVTFGDKQVEYDKNNVDELTLAYAISIHKSQGSEFKCVIMAIHECQEKMLNRNLIYTGISRAKETLVLIGQRDVLNKAIHKIDNTVRNSRIKDKLQGIEKTRRLRPVRREEEKEKDLLLTLL